MTKHVPTPVDARPHTDHPPSYVTAKVTDGAGRYLLEGDAKVFVADSSHRPGGAVALNPGELLVSALAVCALGSVHRVAGEDNITVGALTKAHVIAHRNEAESFRTQFKLINVEVFVDGVEQSVAEHLVGHFTGNCPILNTARRGGPVKVDVLTNNARRTILDNQADWPVPTAVEAA